MHCIDVEYVIIVYHTSREENNMVNVIIFFIKIITVTIINLDAGVQEETEDNQISTTFINLSKLQTKPKAKATGCSVFSFLSYYSFYYIFIFFHGQMVR